MIVLLAVGVAVAEGTVEAPSLEMEIQVVARDVVGLVPEGIRMDGHLQGVFAHGVMAGAALTGMDYLLIRSDGVGVIDARALVVQPDGITATMTFMGYVGEPAPGLLEAMLEPGFECPDVDMPAHGALWLQTMAPQYAYINHTVFGCSGTVNALLGVVRYVCRSLAP